MKIMRLYIGLLHYPVYNKHFERIASAVTTFDLHDIARLARTYEVKKYFVVTPLLDQRELVQRVKSHWTGGWGATYNSNRKEAVRLISVAPSLEQASERISKIEGESPLVIATDASKQNRRSISYQDTRKILRDNKTVFLLFGTAWGLDQTVLDDVDYILDPVEGRGDYRHLSVRSAAAIIIDRLAGRP